MLLASGCSDTDFEPGTVAAIPQSHSIPSDGYGKPHQFGSSDSNAGPISVQQKHGQWGAAVA